MTIQSHCCRFNKDDLIAHMKDRYLEVKQPLANSSVMDLARRVEIEMSKNQKFEVHQLSNFGFVFLDVQF